MVQYFKYQNKEPDKESISIESCFCKLDFAKFALLILNSKHYEKENQSDFLWSNNFILLVIPQC